MSLIVAGLVVAAATGVAATVTALRRWRRRRAAAVAALPAREAKPERQPLGDLPLTAGDLVHCGDETRWPRGAIVARAGGRVEVALLLSREDGGEQAIAAFAPPERALYWLRACEAELPGTAPTRLELDGHLFDRLRRLPVVLETTGRVPALPAQGVVSIYQGAASAAAIVLEVGSARTWLGRRIDAGEWERMGWADPNSDEPGT